MKALITMSGGVDSSVAALLTQNMGYDCIGCTMKLFDDYFLRKPVFYFQTYSSTNSMMSSIVQFNAMQIFPKTSVVTLSP